MAGSKNCYSAYSKSRGTKASKRSLVKRGKKSASWPVRPDITVDNRTFFETTLAVCEKNVAFKQAVINAFVETIDFSDDEDTPQPELQQRQLRLDVWSDVA